MAYYFPEGSKIYFSSTFAGAKTVSGVTNADPAVATSTSHGYVDDDEVLFTSGWEDATDSVYMVDQQSADTFKLLGLNTADTTWFSAGDGTGTAQKISSWVEVPQVLGITSQGGDARFTTVEPLAKRNAINVPTGFNPTSINLTLAHDPANANYQAMQTVARSLTKVAFKLVLSGGATAYGYGYMNVNEMPSLNRNQVNSVAASISLLGRMVSYA